MRSAAGPKGWNLRRGIVRSGDLGQSWCVVTTPAPVSLVAPSRASETVVYATTCARAGAAQLLASGDGGATWTAAALPAGWLDDCAFGLSTLEASLETSMTDSHAVWLHRSDDQATYVSDDAGRSWTSPLPPELNPPIDPQAPDPVIGHVAGMLVDPRSVGRLLGWGWVTSIIGNSTETLRWFATEDGGKSWHEMPAPGLSQRVVASDGSGRRGVVAVHPVGHGTPSGRRHWRSRQIVQPIWWPPAGTTSARVETAARVQLSTLAKASR